MLINVNPALLLVWFGIALAIVACQEAPPPSHNASDLRQSLARLEGQYRWHPDLKHFVYSHKVQLDALLSTHHRDTLINELVNCIDDNSPTSSTIESKPVSVGLLCYEALSQTIYHEPVQADGDIAPSWPGHLSPPVTEDDLKRAKQAWQKVIAAKQYNFL